ncbi:TetR/AcrR family transcriptional regulator [Mycolicibacterium porcinum]|uniref:TetR/AcrR family transcriptional regulator n=1 Tax=Mycolicibacterium porcinum TaxID=39693 RepID=UPI0005693547|nr:TetR/AcrR family transcriptional regulator [Mycolicibacterium porcinum]ORB36141.1 TetR family transcriptional regulator [Mycolicibacterium porcinum]
MAEQTGRTVPPAVAEKLYSATDLIAARGLEKTKIEDIAKSSGVPKATLYYYFKGKDDILAFLFRDSLDALARDVAAAADGPGRGRDRLAAVIQVQVAHTMHRPATAQALVGDLSRAIRLPELASAVQEAFYEPIARVLHAGAADGSLRKLSDPESAAISVFGAIMMTAMLHNVIGSEKAQDQVADEVMQLIENGLAPSR